MAVALAVATGCIHRSVGWSRGRPRLVLAGHGFFGDVALFLAGYRRRWRLRVRIGYVAVQIAVWAVVNAGEYTALGYADKTVQVGSLAVLAALL